MGNDPEGWVVIVGTFMAVLDITIVHVGLPRIIPVHVSLTYREEVAEDLKSVTTELGIDLTPGYEDMVVS